MLITKLCWWLYDGDSSQMLKFGKWTVSTVSMTRVNSQCLKSVDLQNLSHKLWCHKLWVIINGDRMGWTQVGKFDRDLSFYIKVQTKSSMQYLFPRFFQDNFGLHATIPMEGKGTRHVLFDIEEELPHQIMEIFHNLDSRYRREKIHWMIYKLFGISNNLTSIVRFCFKL